MATVTDHCVCELHGACEHHSSGAVACSPKCLVGWVTAVGHAAACSACVGYHYPSPTLPLSPGLAMVKSALARKVRWLWLSPLAVSPSRTPSMTLAAHAGHSNPTPTHITRHLHPASIGKVSLTVDKCAQRKSASSAVQLKSDSFHETRTTTSCSCLTDIEAQNNVS
jgi:hypothetical protein